MISCNTGNSSAIWSLKTVGISQPSSTKPLISGDVGSECRLTTIKAEEKGLVRTQSSTGQFITHACVYAYTHRHAHACACAPTRLHTLLRKDHKKEWKECKSQQRLLTWQLDTLMTSLQLTDRYDFLFSNFRLTVLGIF